MQTTIWVPSRIVDGLQLSLSDSRGIDSPFFVERPLCSRISRTLKHFRHSLGHFSSSSQRSAELVKSWPIGLVIDKEIHAHNRLSPDVASPTRAVQIKSATGVDHRDLIDMSTVALSLYRNICSFSHMCMRVIDVSHPDVPTTRASCDGGDGFSVLH